MRLIAIIILLICTGCASAPHLNVDLQGKEVRCQVEVWACGLHYFNCSDGSEAFCVTNQLFAPRDK